MPPPVRSGSVREYATLLSGAKRVDAGAATLLGGAVILDAPVHALGGPEHTGQLPIERISTTETVVLLVARPDGAGGVEFALATIAEILEAGGDAGNRAIFGLLSVDAATVAASTWVDANTRLSLGGNAVSITYGNPDPSAGAGVVAGPGSLYLRIVTSGNTGQLWLKTAAADTAWKRVFVGDMTRSIFIPARGFSGSSFTAVDTGTTSTRGAVPDAAVVGSLADAATEGHLFLWALPNNAKAATAVSIRIAWRPNSTDASAHTVRWSVDAKALNAGAAVTGAGTTTAFTGASAARTADTMVIDTSTQILASASAEDILRIDVRRVGADAADTYVGVVDIVGIFIDYTAVE